MSCRLYNPKVVDGLSSWDVHVPAPTPAELLIIELLFDVELIEGQTYMGYRWPVLLFRWTEKERDWTDARDTACGEYERHWFTVRGEPSSSLCLRGCGAANPRYVR